MKLQQQAPKGLGRVGRLQPRLAVSRVRRAITAAAQNPFPVQELDGTEQALSNLSQSAFLAVSAAAALAGGGAAAAAVGRAGLPAQVAAGAVVAAGVGYGAKQLNEQRKGIFGKELVNVLAAKADPLDLDPSEVASVAAKYGVNPATDVEMEMRNVYDVFLSAQLPPGDQPLVGDEIENIKRFKAALGITDEVAARAHIDLGRRLSRSKLEVSKRNAAVEATRAFQKLIYVSSQVFGPQQSAFLLPWGRVFNMTEAQLAVAKRDFSRQIFKDRVSKLPGGLPATEEAFRELRAYQEKVGVPIENAIEVIRGATREAVVAMINKAIDLNKSRGAARDTSGILATLHEITAYNRGIEALGGNQELFPAIKAVRLFEEDSVAAGPGNKGAIDDSKRRDLKDLYKLFLEEAAKTGEITEQTEADARELQLTFGMGQKEGKELYLSVQTEAYKSSLRELFTSGALSAAQSPAEVLNVVTERLNMDTEVAMDINFSIFRTRFEQLLEKKTLTESDEAELNNLRRYLCIEQGKAYDLKKELCGKIYRAAIVDAFQAGIQNFGFEEREHCKRAKESLRLEDDLAKEILDAEARKVFLSMVNKARLQGNRLNAAKEMKNLVFFSNIVVSPLLEDAWGETGRKAVEERARQEKEFEEIMKQAREMAKKEEEDEAKKAAAAASGEAPAPEGEAKPEGEAEPAAPAPTAAEAEAKAEEAKAEEAEKLRTLDKAEKAAAARATGEDISGRVSKAQKEINLGKDLEAKDRQDIYKNFLMYCMQGDVVTLGMGSQMVIERDEGEFARLQQLGDVLGLNQMEVSQVHQGLAEQAFRMQVQQVAGDGMMTKDRAEQLGDYRKKLGLSEQQGEKIIKGVTNQKLINNLQQLKAQGKMNLDKVLELKEQGIEVESFVGDDMRLQMFRGEVERVMTDGSGSFDRQRFLERLPEELKLDAKKAAKAVEETVKDRKRLTLVQAISLLRQRKTTDAVRSVNNLISQHSAMPQLDIGWDRPEEVADLYMLYVSQVADETKQGAAAEALALQPADVDRLKAQVAAGGFKLLDEVKKAEATFF